MTAAKHTDLIVGMDMHLVQPPPPAPPVMVPIPFAGMIMDPADYEEGACTVFINGLPRARAGTRCVLSPPHVPIGGTFVMPPTNESELYQGSSTVTADGEAMSATGHQVIGCHDVGAPAPVRPWRSGSARALTMAGGAVIAIPAGSPVNVGGSPTIMMAPPPSPLLVPESIRARFIDQFGRPLSGLRMNWLADGQRLSLMSDDDGRVEVDDVRVSRGGLRFLALHDDVVLAAGDDPLPAPSEARDTSTLENVLASTERSCFLEVPGEYEITIEIPGVGIARVIDVHDVDYAGGAEAIELKACAHGWLASEDDDPGRDDVAVVVELRVWGDCSPFDVVVRYDPADTVRHDFYAQYAGASVDGETFAPPIVRWLRRGARLAPGVHRIAWDGRDDTPDARLLLAGRYTLEARWTVEGDERTSSTAIEIAYPWAHGVGIHFIRGNGGWHSTSPALADIGGYLAALPDATAYATEVTGATRATEVAARWAQSAIAFFDGHGTPLQINFHAVEGEHYRADRASWLTCNAQLEPAERSAGCVSMISLPTTYYRDLLLAVILGCNTGNEIQVVQVRLRQVHAALGVPHANGRVDQRTERALGCYQRCHALPVTRAVDAATLGALGIVPSGDSEADIRAVQRALRALHLRMGRATKRGELDQPTTRALTVFQEAMGLSVTGIADEPTQRRLNIGLDEGFLPLNIGTKFKAMGADVTMVFVEQSSFGPAEIWIRKLFERLARGDSLADAARAATAAVLPRYRHEYEYRLHGRVEAPGSIKIHPARHGARR